MLDTQLPQMEEGKEEEMMSEEVLVEEGRQYLLKKKKGLVLAREHCNALYMFMTPTTTHFDENTETIEMEEFF